MSRKLLPKVIYYSNALLLQSVTPRGTMTECDCDSSSWLIYSMIMITVFYSPSLIYWDTQLTLQPWHEWMWPPLAELPSHVATVLSVKYKTTQDLWAHNHPLIRSVPVLLFLLFGGEIDEQSLDLHDWTSYTKVRSFASLSLMKFFLLNIKCIISHIQ